MTFEEFCEKPGGRLPRVVYIMQEVMARKKVRKHLWKGTFNWSGEVFTIYKRAHNESSAFQLMALEIAKRKSISAWAVRQYFNGKKDNFEVKEESLNV